ncbi:hypothetical protein Cpap_0158 [Ruminiclostridium papyrosolvens DSM 2782]|uniref:Uncharacterized protein n=1 Tax=Ruminiclostridium papyrosolvens DSM 2782 TaxID=588581 RepID=F1TIH4_9FIRM|nr:hypothetical protein [Ruminiclostridium papyrosolvens]EGD45791.1 hypothetical protein Cpap_0158 [Ruminiclostridium papyrosolvens DSM 2782]WES33889.1 hypothetical protein P0092_19310 [Ruminiclostridium papyrosolvens DSM 2782]
MKLINNILLILTLLIALMLPQTVFAADGEGNIDHGGGGMGNSSEENYWTGDDGVRVTVIRLRDRKPVTVPIDFTNTKPINIAHFGKVCKVTYTAGRVLTPSTSTYECKKPDRAMPKIVRTKSRNPDIKAIKEFFCSEYMVTTISNLTGFNYETLTDGDYKILLEPIAYMTFSGINMAMTATEAALYNQRLGGELRKRMVSLSNKNLPLAMFLEVPDLGYPAWSGSTTAPASDEDIISSLGLGIVKFKEAEQPQVSPNSYTYRVNTEVISSVTISGGRSDPDNPVTVQFNIGGTVYTVGNVYYPEGKSQLAWVRWKTPSKPQTMTINVSVSNNGRTDTGIMTVKIVDLSGNDPPNPTADDRNYSYSAQGIPSNEQKTSASWGVWHPHWHQNLVWQSDMNWYSDNDGGGYWQDDGEWIDIGWWDFSCDTYHAVLSASMNIAPDEKAPTAFVDTMKSGYGIKQMTEANVSTNQSSAVTEAQTAVTYFPEFLYKTYWRLLEQTSRGYRSAFEFHENRYSTYNRRTHFTPVWMPDGSYTPYTYLIDCWTPNGMLSVNLTDSITIDGSLWDDWRVIPAIP